MAVRLVAMKDNNNDIVVPPVDHNRRLDTIIIEEDVDHFRKQAYKWKRIADHFNVSDRSLRKWRKDNNYIDPLIPINNDEDLDTTLVHSYADGYKDRGIKMMQCCFLQDGYKVSREKVRESARRVDPEGVEQRKSVAVKKRGYKSAGPTSFVAC